jgi:hypothetical protein
MPLENVKINGKRISDFKINCDKARICPWMANPADVYSFYPLIRDYCSKEGLGCETKYSLIQKEMIKGN